MNVRTKFEVRSITRSLDNRGYLVPGYPLEKNSREYFKKCYRIRTLGFSHFL